MTTTNAVSSGAANVNALTGTTSSVGKTENQFLQLLVTQMQNQDPLNPMDNAQVTSQIAQLNTVQGIDNLNTTLTSLAANFTASQSMQATGLIGHNVLSPGATLSLQGGTAVFGVDLPQSVDTLKVSIQDATGKLLHTVDVGPHAAGTVVLGWDGKTDSGQTAADGAYNFVIKAASGGTPVAANSLSVNQVQSVTMDSTGAVLNLGGGQTATLSDVKQFM